MKEFTVNELLWPQIYCGCVVGQEFIFPAANYNGIFSLDMHTGKISHRNYFMEETFSKKYLSSVCLNIGKKIVKRLANPFS